jgi:hypothetical protein
MSYHLALFAVLYMIASAPVVYGLSVCRVPSRRVYVGRRLQLKAMALSGRRVGRKLRSIVANTSRGADFK